MGSSPTFVIILLKKSECSAAGSVSVLGIEGHKFKSYHSDKITFLNFNAKFTFISYFFFNF